MFNRSSIFILAPLCAATIAVAAFAQVPAAQPPLAATAAARPTHNCVKPEQPGRRAPDSRIKAFGDDLNTYRDCMQAFAKAQGDLAKTQSDLAKLHTEIGNSAIIEYNEYIAELNKKKDEEAAKK